MGTCIITFRSVTPAQRTEKILRSAGIHCYLGRTPRWMEEQGCGYSIRVQFGIPEDLVKLLREHKIPFRKLYLRTDDGELQEVRI